MSLMQKLMPQRTTYSPIAIDLGRSAVRVAQLLRRGGTWHAHRIGTWHRPADSPSDESSDAGIRRVGNWLTRFEFAGRTALVGLSTPDLEVHALELPPAGSTQSVAQWRQIADAEIKRLSRRAGTDLATDVWRLPDQRRSGPSAIGVGAQRGVVERANRICRVAGLDCAMVDATACGLARFGRTWLGRVETESIWGLLDLGERMSRLVVCMLRTPVLARSFEYSGDSWTRRLGEALSVSPEAARRHKHDHGIVRLSRHRSRSDSRDTDHGLVGEMIFNVLRCDLDAMFSEIERSFRYAMQCFPGISLGPLLLVGAGARMRNLSELVSEQLGIRVVVPAPDAQEAAGELSMSNLGAASREPLCAFAAAIGLALPDEEDDDGTG